MKHWILKPKVPSLTPGTTYCLLKMRVKSTACGKYQESPLTFTNYFSSIHLSVSLFQVPGESTDLYKLFSFNPSFLSLSSYQGYCWGFHHFWLPLIFFLIEREKKRGWEREKGLQQCLNSGPHPKTFVFAATRLAKWFYFYFNHWIFHNLSSSL